MRILATIGSVAPDFGGPAVGSARLNEALNQIGCNAVLVSTDIGLSGSDVSLGVDTANHQYLRLELYPASMPQLAENSWRLWFRVFRLAKTADVLHLHGIHRAPTVAAFLAARLWGKPYGIQPHGLLEPFTRANSRNRKWLFDLLIGRRMVRNAAYVLFASETEATRASDVVEAAQTLVHPLGAQLSDELTQLSGDVGEAVNAAGRGQCVCFMGRFAAKKQPLLLVEAWAQAGRREGGVLVFAGPDGDITGAELRSAAVRLGVSDSVYVIGTVAGAEKSWLLDRCATFVLPSLNENFGVTVAEAMLAGMHVVTTQEVAASEHLDYADSGKVLRQPNASDLANALSLALSDPDSTWTSGRRAQAYAQKHLTWGGLASALRERLESVAR